MNHKLNDNDIVDVNGDWVGFYDGDGKILSVVLSPLFQGF